MKGFLGVMFVALLAACGVRRGDIVVIPAEYEGWVQIRYQVDEAPELRKESGANLIVVPSSGIVKTRSVRSPGYGQDHYFLRDARGGRIEIPSDGGQKDGRSVSNFQYFSSPAKVTIFFVGNPKKIDFYKRPIPEEFVNPGTK